MNTEYILGQKVVQWKGSDESRGDRALNIGHRRNVSCAFVPSADTGPDETIGSRLNYAAHNLTVSANGIREMLACQRMDHSWCKSNTNDDYRKQCWRYRAICPLPLPIPLVQEVAATCWSQMAALDSPLFDSKRGNNFSLMVHKDLMPIFVSVSVIRGNSIDACFPLCFQVFPALLLCQKIRVHPYFFHPCRGNFNYFFLSNYWEFELSRIRVCACVWYLL